MTILIILVTLGNAIWAAQLWFKGLSPSDRARLEAENNRLSAEAELLRDMLNRQPAAATPKRQPARRRNAA